VHRRDRVELRRRQRRRHHRELRRVRRDDARGESTWTAKLAIVACNAWDAAQARWLDDALAEATTYTFVVRHQSSYAVDQTPCAASAAIIARHPLTLLVAGHTHAYYHAAKHREIVVGNGGAPLTSSTNYGYAIISRQPDGAIAVTAYDYASNAAIDAFAIDAAGESR
jgi:predicted phosphodiesterase